jgi:hypothetical protein
MERVKEILSYLQGKEYILHEGPKRLQKYLKDEYTIEECKLALSEFRKSKLDIKDAPVEVIEVPGNLELKKMWNNGKQWCASFASKSDAPDQSFKEDLLSELKQINTTKELYQHGACCPYMIEINLPDFHFGNDNGMSLEEQAEEYFNTVVKLYSMVHHLGANQIVFVVGNDALHIDNLQKNTTAGTPQDTNATPQAIFRTAWTATVRAINFLKQYALVDVIVVWGNHDYMSSFHLGEVLEAYFCNDFNVRIDNSFDQRKYYRYGTNLIGYTHGDKEKPHQLPLIMATEQARDWAECTSRHWRIGHFHKFKNEEYQGVEVTVVPSLTKHNNWHKSMGYLSIPKAQVYVWHETNGKLGYFETR